MARRVNRELIEITNPHLALCISGTPKQVHNLMPEVENGLFSRFMYYAFQVTRGLLNPFVSYQPINYENYFTTKGYEVYHLQDKLKNLSTPIKFELTTQQGIDFTKFFQTMLDKNNVLMSRDLDDNTKRLGVITFRIAMLLSALRLMDLEIGQKYPETIICSDSDYKTAMLIASTLERHAIAVYQLMPRINMKGVRLSFFEKLPSKFNREQYLGVAKELGISSKAADKYIGIFKDKLLKHTYNLYEKIF